MREPPWVPMHRPIEIKHMGKLLEELGELGAAVAAVIHPAVPVASTPPFGRQVLQRLQEELSDVYANIELVQRHFALDGERVTWAREEADKVVPPTHNRGVGLPTKVKDAIFTLLMLSQAVGCTVAIASRCLIQGIEEREPDTHKLNREALEEAFGWMISWMKRATADCRLDPGEMARRELIKIERLREWHNRLGVEGAKWMLWYAEPGIGPEIFIGEDAEQSARQRFRAQAGAWSCTLLAQVARA